MNYEEVQALMKTHHDNVAGKRGARTDPDRKRICNETYLIKVHQNEPYYTLSLFNNEIITWYPTAVYLNDQGWFSKTIFQRWNAYLPKGFSVRAQRARYKQGVVAFVHTPDGTYPYYKSPMAFTYDGEQANYTKRALPAYQALPGYVDDYIKKLFTRQLTYNEPTILECVPAVDIVLLKMYPAGLIDHVLDKLNKRWKEQDERALQALTQIGACGIRRAKNKQEEALQTELTLGTGTTMDRAAVDTKKFQVKIRHELTHGLLTLLGFTFHEWNER